MSMKNRTHELPVSSAVPRPTAPPCVQCSKKVKGNVVAVQAKMAYRGGVGEQLHSFFNSAPGGYQSSVSRLGHLAPGKETWWAGEWVPEQAWTFL